ncbi:signal peptide containing protein [Theileria equi strain WA]|uniref:Signal peptide containing protein n=1 Tax=Theileria equi strain WA TaxID=1537102 RepID=L1LB88_THEEQ|nr:signal peptide containing protein [Theileria equi strain WA]EKX72423.1 signal peptide containing protein [Theileria equi strain WA]|eukprot:XP_004831875.1 signal peptide containing protein [Theileria equi strain WA]
MRILAVLLTVSLVRLCHGKGGSKKPPTQPATPAVKQGNTPVQTDGQNPQKQPKVQPAPKQSQVASKPAKPGSVPEVKQEKKPPANLQGSVKKEQAQPPTKTADKPVESLAPVQEPHKPTTLPPVSTEAPSKESPATQSTGKTSVLDLLNPDVESVHVGGGDEDGLAKRVFTPNDGFAVKSVVSGGDLVWKAGAGEKCTLVESYSKGESMLAYLKVDGDSGPGLNYFEKVGGKWVTVELRGFYQKVGEMRKKKEESINKDMEKHLQRAKDGFKKIEQRAAPDAPEENVVETPEVEE